MQLLFLASRVFNFEDITCFDRFFSISS